MPPPEVQAAALLESDRAYFALGATTVRIEGAVIASMAGLEPLAGAIVVQRVQEDAIADPTRWVGEVTERLRDAGATMARVYLGDGSPEPSGLELALAAGGYRPRTEIGYLARGSISPRPDDAGAQVSLSPVTDEAGWEQKHKLHAGSETASDGHVSPAGEWVELERRKCEAGGMEAFLVESDGEVCGAVATLTMPDVRLLRAKNVFVHPDHRRQGIASRTIRALSRRAPEYGLEATGIFGVEGNPGNSVYVSLGMTPVVKQVEWARPVGAGRR